MNNIHTGKGMKLSPNAKLDDGLLDLILIENNVTRFELAKLLSKLFDGSHIKSNFVKYMQVKNVSINPKINEHLNIDGEIKEITPIQISVLPKKLIIYN